MSRVVVVIRRTNLLLRMGGLPLAHASSHATGGTDPITPAAIGAETPAGAAAQITTHDAIALPHGATTTGASLLRALTAAAARLALAFGAVDVRDYGAVGNGVTDDLAAFQQALSTGRPVRVPNGDWRLSATLTLPNNAFLFGAGESSRIFCAANDNNVLSASTRTGVVVADLWVDNTSALASNAFVGWSIAISGSSRCTVRGCRVSGYLGGIYLGNSSDCCIADNHCTALAASTATSADFMLDAYGGQSLRNVISGNWAISGSTQGILVRASGPTDLVHETSITGNKVRQKSYYGIHAYCFKPGQIYRIDISGNHVRDITGAFQVDYPPLRRPGGAGIYCQGAEWFTVRGNHITACNASTDHEDHAPGAIGVSDASCGIIADNTIDSTSWHGIYLNDQDNNGNGLGSIHLRGNILSRCGREAIKGLGIGSVAIHGGSITTTTSGPGILITNTTAKSSLQIADVTITNPATDGISLTKINDVSIHDVRVSGFTGIGLRLDDCDRCTIARASTDGANIGGTTSLRLESTCADVSVLSCTGKNGGAASFGLVDNSGCRQLDNDFSGCTTPLSGSGAAAITWCARMIVGPLNPGGSQALQVYGGIRANGSESFFGNGGSGAFNSILHFDGSSASDYGAQIRLLRGGVLRGMLGTYGAIFGGNSSDLTLYTPAGYQVRIAVNGFDNFIAGSAGNTLGGDQNITAGVLKINGVQVVGSQGAAVPNATGGSVIDVEARSAINTLLARLRTSGAIAT